MILDALAALYIDDVDFGGNLVTQTDGDQQQDGPSGFEIWQSGDQMKNANGQSVTVQDAPGDGSKFLELNPVASDLDTLGISRSPRSQPLSKLAEKSGGGTYWLTDDPTSNKRVNVYSFGADFVRRAASRARPAMVRQRRSPHGGAETSFIVL